MLYKLPYSVDTDHLLEAVSTISNDQTKLTINQPTGNFFYDEWELKPEYKDTIWELVYNSLGKRKGEARIIRLNGGESYISHADVDDRYHLNLSGIKSFLIDLDRNKMHETLADGIWYQMDAGQRHSAVNFGNKIRYQLVVRTPLIRGCISDPIDVIITANNSIDPNTARFIFDDTISGWLNDINKEGLLDNFSYANNVVTFTTDAWHVYKLEDLLPNEFLMELK